MLQSDVPRGSAPTPQPAAANAAAPTMLEVGDIIADNYIVRGVIGSGAMGQVYEAHDEALNRTVAIKMAWSSVDGNELLAEARALAAFHHPGVVAVHGFGRHRERPFIVMERILGRNLLEYLRMLHRRGDRFTIEEVIDILQRVCETVSTVHEAGILHCDLKPDNLLLAANRRVVLLDFGVFQPERWLADKPQLSATPYYAAPEIVVNEIEPGRGYLVDIYAVGVIGYEMLTGHPPFRGETASQTLLKHVSQPVPSIAEQRPDVPAWLDQLLTSMMAKDPLERPESMERVISQLQARRPRRSTSRPGDTTSVLVVDDDEDFRELVAQCVRRNMPHAEIRTAVDGEDALECFREHPPALLITDLQMPRLGGLELCMYLRGTQLADRTKIVAMSAHAGERDRDLLRQLGITRVLSKTDPRPDSFPKAIAEALQTALASRK